MNVTLPTPSALQDLLDHSDVRRILEKYMSCLDRRDYAGIASCFTDDAEIQYDLKPWRFKGGRELADQARFIEQYTATNHAVSNVDIELSGDTAHTHIFAVATLLAGTEVSGRVLVRGIHYEDWLARSANGWRISRRIHRPTWQFDAESQVRVFPAVPGVGQAAEKSRV